MTLTGQAGTTYFNPRSTRGGATRLLCGLGLCAQLFQSTLPTRGSDFAAQARHPPPCRISIHAPHEGERRVRPYAHIKRTAYFNPRSPRGGATYGHQFQNYAYAFQSTLPTRGSDNFAVGHSNRSPHFNPRSPRGGATFCPLCIIRSFDRISIHAPHEGERRSGLITKFLLDKFQSTLPTRGSDSGKVHLYTAFPRIC